MAYACSIERFKYDVREHRMSVIHNDGLHRHIRFKRPGTSVYYFDLITWPGSLTITGDCGTYTFSRTRDMFNFFGDYKSDPTFINPSYWGEKLDAIDRSGGFEEFSGAKFAALLKSWVSEHDFDDGDDKTRLVQFLDYEDFGENIQSMEEAYDFIGNTASDAGYEEFQIEELWGCGLRDFTFRYIWCIRAIRWGIRQYQLGGDRYERQRKADATVFRARNAA